MKNFFPVLLGVCAGTGLVLLALVYLVPAAGNLGVYSAVVIALFAALSVLFFVLGRILARSPNRLAFNGLISASVFIKIVAAILFLAVYREVKHPGNTWYVVLFLLAYAPFTFFEVWFMTRLGHLKPEQ